jgi:hypothetical protein
LITKEVLDSYLEYDDIFSKPLLHPDFKDSLYTTWLKDSLPKRYIFNALYGDLFIKNTNTVLDVGGGITPYSLILKEACKSYDLCDIISHDKFLKKYVIDFLCEKDWIELNSLKYDIVIANDIFPNVDQRLDLFIERFLPLCSELRLSLTFYNNKKYYLTKRIDAEERLVFSAYDGFMCKAILNKYKKFIINYNEKIFDLFDASPVQSLFPNKRHVMLIKLKENL